MGKAFSWTTIQDLRQAAEAEVVSGVGSQLALPGGIALGEGAALTITGAPSLEAGRTFEQLTSSMDSTLGKVLGLTGQLAAGIFEQGAQTTQALTGMREGLFTAQEAVAATGTQQAALASDTKGLIMTIIIALGLLFLFGRR